MALAKPCQSSLSIYGFWFLPRGDFNFCSCDRELDKRLKYIDVTGLERYWKRYPLMSSNGAKSVKKPWSFEDLVDFEYAIRLESNDSTDRIEKRDRKVLERLEEDVQGSLNNRDLLKTWLDLVKASLFPKTWNPGELTDRTINLVSKIAFAIALMMGLTLAAGFFSYEGSEPVNVSAYVGVFVIFQLALAAISLLLILLLRWATNAFDCFLGIRILSPLFFHLAGSLIRYGASRMDSTHRSVVKDVSGDLKSVWVIYRAFLQTKIFAHFQTWAIGFNLGVIGATILIVLFSDRAFGWQTTLQVDAEWLHHLVRLTSLPWSWFAGEGVGFPSLSEIEGSRIILKDGIRSLNSEDLVSWWPYLVLGTIVYGLLPRLVFYVWGRMASRHCLNRLSFSHAEANRIVERIRGRDVGFDSSADRMAILADSTVSADANEISKKGSVPGEGAVCLLVSDYHQDLPVDLVREELSRKLRLRVDDLEIIPIGAENQMDPESLSLSLDSKDHANMFMVFASWMPPIEEIKQLILAVRRKLGSNRLLYIQLLGPRESEKRLHGPKEQEVLMWKTFIRRLGDPYCSLNPTEE